MLPEDFYKAENKQEEFKNPEGLTPKAKQHSQDLPDHINHELLFS